MILPDFFEWWHIPIVFIAWLVWEWYWSLIWWWSIVIQSCLVFLWLPPHSAVAIDNAWALWSEFWIISVTWRKIAKYTKLIAWIVLVLIIGWVYWTHIFVNLDAKIIEYLMIAMVSIMLIYSFTNKKSDLKPNHKHYFLFFLILMFMGFYNNIVWIWEGTFSRLALMSLLWFSFVECQWIKTLWFIPIRIYSWIITASVGLIIYPYLITLLVSNFIAWRYATKFASIIPERIMKKMLSVVAIMFIVYLLIK